MINKDYQELHDVGCFVWMNLMKCVFDEIGNTFGCAATGFNVSGNEMLCVSALFWLKTISTNCCL